MLSKKIFITGGAGFIGSHLAELLVISGYKVTTLVHYDSRASDGFLATIDSNILREIKIERGNICDYAQMSKSIKGQDVVIHLAALIAIPYSYQAVESYIDTNISGTHNLLQACIEREVEKFIHTSSSEVYGTARYFPIDENHPLFAQSPYSATKIGADKIVESFYNTYKMPVVTIRPFNNYGPRQSQRAVIPTIISQMLNSNSLKLGLLSPRRDFLYVKDTARAYLAAVQKKGMEGQTINLGTGKGVSIHEVVGILEGIIGKKAKVIKDPRRLRPRDSEVMNLVSDSSKAKKALGWTAKVPLNQGLAETVDWIRQNRDYYKPTQYTI